jgi:hypothetical protein
MILAKKLTHLGRPGIFFGIVVGTASARAGNKSRRWNLSKRGVGKPLRRMEIYGTAFTLILERLFSP